MCNSWSVLISWAPVMLAVGCGPFNMASISMQDVPDQHTVYRVIDEALDEWKDRVGPMNQVNTMICGNESCVPTHVSSTAAGRCSRAGDYREIDVYVHRFSYSLERQLRYVYLHELAHAHMTCSDADHTSAHGTELMAEKYNNSYTEPLLDDELVARIHRSMGLPWGLP